MKHLSFSALVSVLFVFLLSPSTIIADTITKPHTFTAGNPALASEVNANFDTVYDQVNKMGTSIDVDQVTGNVGIGTSASATSKLDVNGTIVGAIPVSDVAVSSGPTSLRSTGLFVATVPSTNKVHVRFFMNLDTLTLDTESNWTAWQDFGEPEASTRIIDISASMDSGPHAGRVTAVITARTSTGKVFSRMFADKVPADLDKIASWTTWVDFSSPGM